MNDKVQCLTPVGRIVSGHPLKRVPVIDPVTKRPKLTKEGQPAQQYAFRVAFPKAEFEQKVWPFMQAAVAKQFPNGVPQGFSWKFKDGDNPGLDARGKPYNTREGWAGHYILSVSSSLETPPPAWREGGVAGQWTQIGVDDIKTGDYCILSLTFAWNGVATGTQASIYVNPESVLWVGYGTAIATAARDPNEVFAGLQYTLPPGASRTPTGPAGGMLPPGVMQQPAGMPQMQQPAGMPQMQQPAGMPGMTPQMQQPAGMTPQMQQPAGMAPQMQQMPGVAPAYDLVQGAGYQMPGTFPGMPR